EPFPLAHRRGAGRLVRRHQRTRCADRLQPRLAGSLGQPPDLPRGHLAPLLHRNHDPPAPAARVAHGRHRWARSLSALRAGPAAGGAAARLRYRLRYAGLPGQGNRAATGWGVKDEGPRTKDEMAALIRPWSFVQPFPAPTP